jgi:integrase
VPKLNLTDLTVQRLSAGTYYDKKTPAFGIRVGSNRRTWIVVKGERRTKIRLGHYPSMSLADARKRAFVVLGSPLEQKPQIAFLEAKDAFLAEGRWRASTKRVVTSNLQRFTWKRNVDKITHADIIDVLDAIKGPSARAHALKDLRALFAWCIPRYLSVSPCVGITAQAGKARDRILEPDELLAVWAACEGTFGTIVKLLILTGQRKMEIGTLTQQQVQEDRIIIPSHVAKNGREHTFPIGVRTRSLLPMGGISFLFRASDGEACYNGYTYHLKLLQKASRTANWTLHDLRRTYVSLHAQIGTPIHVAEKLVNHVSGTFGGVRGIYDRYSYWDEMVDATKRYERHVLALVEGSSRKRVI